MCSCFGVQCQSKMNDEIDQRQKDEQATQTRAGLLNLPYMDVRTYPELPKFELLSNADMYQMHAVILQAQAGSMIIGVTTRTGQRSMNELKNRFSDYNVEFRLISDVAFRDFMRMYDPPKEVHYQDIDIKPDQQQSSVSEVSAQLDQVRADDMFSYLVTQAQKLGASDIHLENADEDVRIRFRVDGVMHEIARLNRDKFRQLMSSIAIAANVSVEATASQTGHVEFKLPNPPEGSDPVINMRVETIPTIHGQDVVLRVFTLDKDLLKLENLGLDERQRKLVDEVVAHPTGLVMSVGPTGSGKTTTLYSILSALNTPDKKIITLEDPVEYHLPGVVQIPVNTNKDEHFADKLRSILRLDPDVVMVGEIRDIDTAKAALQASLSGHLVLTTFHANDAPSALSRLLDMVGENPLFASAIRLVIAQRLVRTFNESQREPDSPDEHVLALAQKEMDSLPEGYNRPNLRESNLQKPKITPDTPFGYVGQTAVTELLTMSDGLRDMLRRPAREVTADLFAEQARKDGMVTMLQDGIIKAANGTTSLAEVYRVVG